MESIIGLSRSVISIVFFAVDCRKPPWRRSRRKNISRKSVRKERLIWGTDAASTGGQDARHRESNAKDYVIDLGSGERPHRDYGGESAALGVGY